MIHQRPTVLCNRFGIDIAWADAITETYSQGGGTMIQLMLIFVRKVIINEIASELEAFVFARSGLERLNTCRLENKSFDRADQLNWKLVDTALGPRTNPATKTQRDNRWNCLYVGFKVSAEFVNV